MPRLTKGKSNINQQPPATLSPWYVVQLLGEIGFVIAVPLVVFLLIGRWIDIRLQTNILFTLLGMGVSLATSTYIIYKKIQKIQ